MATAGTEIRISLSISFDIEQPSYSVLALNPSVVLLIEYE